MLKLIQFNPGGWSCCILAREHATFKESETPYSGSTARGQLYNGLAVKSWLDLFNYAKILNDFTSRGVEH